jgi:subfamily B ATP-binding cassette protein MsbA
MMNGVKVEIFFQIILFGLAIAVLFVSTTILQMPLPLLLIFIFILIRLTEPLRNLNNQRHVITGELASLEKIDQILSESRRAKMIENGSDTFDGFKDTIRLNQVNFSYGPTIPTLTDISFDIKKNEMVAIIGASGSGKSTIVDLIIRLMDPISGDIQIDNKNLREFNLESYHNKIGFVSQESYIFHDSVLNNICYGADRISLDEAIDAAKIANAHEFISNLPKGYRTEVGEKGIKLSGGEKQRIALARALYRNPEILILDEATSALDSESEKVIQESIAKIKNKYTIIAIAHRLSTIENADKIIVIDQGKLIESGTHQNLMQNKGIYWKYHFIQYNGNNS